MHILKVVLIGVGETLIFQYKTEDRAMSHYLALRRQGLHQSLDEAADSAAPFFDLEDDYGVRTKIGPYSVALVMLIDADKMIAGNVTFQLDQNRIAQRVQGSYTGALLTPAGGGGRILSS